MCNYIISRTRVGGFRVYIAYSIEMYLLHVITSKNSVNTGESNFCIPNYEHSITCLQTFLSFVRHERQRC